MSKILFQWTSEARKKLEHLVEKVDVLPACHADAKEH